MSVFGSIDENGDDPMIYDYVVMAADVGSVQSIFTETLNNYVSDPKITKILSAIYTNSIGQMKIAPPYKVKFKIFKIISSLKENIYTLGSSCLV